MNGHCQAATAAVLVAASVAGGRARETATQGACRLDSETLVGARCRREGSVSVLLDAEREGKVRKQLHCTGAAQAALRRGNL